MPRYRLILIPLLLFHVVFVLADKKEDKEKSPAKTGDASEDDDLEDMQEKADSIAAESKTMSKAPAKAGSKEPKSKSKTTTAAPTTTAKPSTEAKISQPDDEETPGFLRGRAPTKVPRKSPWEKMPNAPTFVGHLIVPYPTSNFISLTMKQAYVLYLWLQVRRMKDLFKEMSEGVKPDDELNSDDINVMISDYSKTGFLKLPLPYKPPLFLPIDAENTEGTGEEREPSINSNLLAAARPAKATKVQQGPPVTKKITPKSPAVAVKPSPETPGSKRQQKFSTGSKRPPPSSASAGSKRPPPSSAAYKRPPPSSAFAGSKRPPSSSAGSKRPPSSSAFAGSKRPPQPSSKTKPKSSAGSKRPPPITAALESRPPPPDTGSERPAPMASALESRPPPPDTGSERPPPITAALETRPPPSDTGLERPPPITAALGSRPPPPDTGSERPSPITAALESRPPPPDTGSERPSPITAALESRPPPPITGSQIFPPPSTYHFPSFPAHRSQVYAKKNPKEWPPHLPIKSHPGVVSFPSKVKPRPHAMYPTPEREKLTPPISEQPPSPPERKVGLPPQRPSPSTARKAQPRDKRRFFQRVSNYMNQLGTGTNEQGVPVRQY